MIIKWQIFLIIYDTPVPVNTSPSEKLTLNVECKAKQKMKVQMHFIDWNLVKVNNFAMHFVVATEYFYGGCLD